MYHSHCFRGSDEFRGLQPMCFLDALQRLKGTVVHVDAGDEAN